jgi:hypothetical protein
MAQDVVVLCALGSPCQNAMDAMSLVVREAGYNIEVREAADCYGDRVDGCMAVVFVKSTDDLYDLPFIKYGESPVLFAIDAGFFGGDVVRS